MPEIFGFLLELPATRWFTLWPGGFVAFLLGAGSLAWGLLVFRSGRTTVRALSGVPLSLLLFGSAGFAAYLLGASMTGSLLLVCALLGTGVLLAAWRKPQDLVALLSVREFLLLLALLATGAVLAAFGTNEVRDSTVRAIPGAWGDAAFHTLIARHFVIRPGTDLSAPHFAGDWIHEPVVFDALSAMLLRGGFTVAGASAVPATLLFASLFASLASLAAFMAPRTRRVAAGALAAFLAVFLGGLQWFVVAATDGSWSFQEFFGRHASAWDMNVERGHVMPNYIVVFSSQRHLLLAAAWIAVLALTLVRRRTSDVNARHDWPLGPLAIATGLLPLFHAHGFLVAGALWFAAALWFKRRAWFLIGASVALVAAPILLWESQSFTRDGFLKIVPGWYAWQSAPRGVVAAAFSFVRFWIVNTGVVIPLTLLAAYRRRTVAAILLPAAAAIPFAIGNVLQLQPYLWDNQKLFLLAETLVLPVIVGELLSWTVRGNTAVKYLGAVAAAAVVISMSLTTLSEVYSLAYARAQYPLYTPAIRSAAALLDASLPTAAVVFAATDRVHNHPLTLTGRALVSGYGGWIWSHGFDWENRARLFTSALAASTREEFCDTLAPLAVTHVVITDAERSAWPEASSPAVQDLLGLAPGGEPSPPRVLALRDIC